MQVVKQENNVAIHFTLVIYSATLVAYYATAVNLASKIYITLTAGPYSQHYIFFVT
jgi:hypothetical protein